MRKRHFFKMKSTGLWLIAAIVLIIITQATSLDQTIQKLNNNDPATHLKLVQINSKRTKQNASNSVDGIDETSKLQAKMDQSDESNQTKDSDKPRSRKKRLIWITDDGRLALPPGTVLSITPTLSLPLVRYPLEGFLSNMTMSFPLTIDFDKLGLTDNENPLGVLPPIFARSMGRAAGSYLADYIGGYLTSREERSLEDDQGDFMTIAPEKAPTLADTHKHAFHGGERAILYGIAEDILATFGMNGKACMLRTICEIHSKQSLEHLGLFGEIAKLFLTVTKSNYAHMMTEYVRAQQVGEGKIGPGECFPYYKKCPKSIFKSGSNANKYSDKSLSEGSEILEEDLMNLDEAENEIEQQSRGSGMASPVFNM